MVGGFHGSVTAICETFKISCLMGRHPVRGGSHELMDRREVERNLMEDPISAKDNETTSV